MEENKKQSSYKLEKELEIKYIYAMSHKSPLGEIINSLKNLGQHFDYPNLFLEMSPVINDLFAYCELKNPNISYQDCVDYVAWKVWQNKLENPAIINHPVCRTLGYFMAIKIFKEVYKGGSRNQRIKNEFKELISTQSHSEFYPKFLELEKKLDESTSVTTQCLEILMDSYNEVLKELKNTAVKELEGGNNG